VRQLLPEVRDIGDDESDLSDLYGRPAGIRLNMIASADGAASAGGLSGALGGAADKKIFASLRSLADVIVVGAGTVRAERYGPARLSPAARQTRRAAGRGEVPPIAVVTSGAQLDWSRPFFTDAEARPIVITTSAAPHDLLARAREVAEVIVAGDTHVDLPAAIAGLRGRGFSSFLAEGGPRLAGQLAAAGILDELCLTLSPKLVAGDGPRILHGPALPAPAALNLVHLLEEDGFVFLRYRKA
jgi:riboflavin biosynthesis pyrimidine reductase